ncbi:MAG: Arc family DNA-binding protein [Oscillospiraceae bacterium]|nr:Arc family DNA-binding protein [Oscillospiraceae bacterium]
MAENENSKKQIPLRLSKSLWEELVRLSESDFRSLNGEIEYLLTEAVRIRNKKAHD